MGVWPFLISRSRDVDYQVIVSPDFLVKANRDQLIKKVIGAKAQEISPQLRWEQVKERGFERLHIAYSTDVAKLGDVELRDRAGRRVLRIYGLVFDDQDLRKDGQKVSHLFAQASRVCNEALEAFWNDNAERQAVPSGRLDLPLPLPPGSRRWKAAALGVMGALVVSLLANAWLFSEKWKWNFERRKLEAEAKGTEAQIASQRQAITQLQQQLKQLREAADQSRAEPAPPRQPLEGQPGGASGN
jgi:hypothetical protein